MRCHPYRVLLAATPDLGYKFYTFVLAGSAPLAKQMAESTLFAAQMAERGSAVRAVSARKQNLSRCEFYKKFGKQKTEEYFWPQPQLEGAT